MTLTCAFFDVGGTLGTVDTQRQLHLFPDTAALVAQLGGIGLRLGVISNVPATMNGATLKVMLAGAGIDELFDPELILASTDLGVEKPDPAAFTIASNRANARPEQCVFIGENVAELVGAQAAGMRTQLRTPK